MKSESLRTVTSRTHRQRHFGAVAPWLVLDGLCYLIAASGLLVAQIYGHPLSPRTHLEFQLALFVAALLVALVTMLPLAVAAGARHRKQAGPLDRAHLESNILALEEDLRHLRTESKASGDGGQLEIALRSLRERLSTTLRSRMSDGEEAGLIALAQEIGTLCSEMRKALSESDTKNDMGAGAVRQVTDLANRLRQMELTLRR